MSQPTVGLPQNFSASDNVTNQPLVGGQLFTYMSGTNTPLATYYDVGLTSPCPNPIILDNYGQAVFYLQPQLYRFNLLNAAGVQQAHYPQDNIQAVGYNLATNLADTTSASNGAGLVGYNSSLAYGANTVGAGLNAAATTANLASTSSAAKGQGLVGFNPSLSYASGTLPNALTSSASASVGQGLVGFSPSLSYGAGTLPGALASGQGASLIGLLQPGSGAVPTTGNEFASRTVYLADFLSPAQKADILSGSPAIDCSAAITTCVTYCNTLQSPHLVCPSGVMLLTNSVAFSMPPSSTIDFFGQFKCSGAGIILGSTSGYTESLTVNGLSVTRSTLDGAGSSIGVTCWDLVRSKINIRKAYGFYEGVRVTSQQSSGCAYNRFEFGELASNTINLRLTVNSASSGYTNENSFYGGNFTHFGDYTTAYPSAASVNIQIDNNTGAGGAINNNKFYGPSLEDTTTSAIGAVINGIYNVIYSPRLENSNNQLGYQIQFTANSSFCSILGIGYQITRQNISDSGSCNTYFTQTLNRIANGATTTAGDATLQLMSLNNSSSHVLSILNSGNTEQAYVLGTGAAYFLNASIRNLIIRAPAQIYVANGANASYSFPGSTTYAYISTSVATLNVIFPAAASVTDGTVLSFATTLAQTGMTLSCTGATFPGIYSGSFTLAANTALRFIYNAANTMWFPF